MINMSVKGWLDVHGHFALPFKSAAEHDAFVKGINVLCFIMPKRWKWDLDDSLAYNDKAGVQMQTISFQPSSLKPLRETNTYGAEQVKKHLAMFGLLCALPTDDTEVYLAEIDHERNELHADGFAVSAVRNNVMLSDPSLEPVWAKLESMVATVWSHPNATAGPGNGRPNPLIEVVFETCRVLVDIIYRKIFIRYPNVKFMFSHCGGALSALSGRVELLGTEDWVPNPTSLTRREVRVWINFKVYTMTLQLPLLLECSQL